MVSLRRLSVSLLDKVLGNLGSYVGIKVRHDDDFADRLSHHYTTILLVIFTIVVSTKQYVGDAIQCWCPAQFTSAHVNYANQVCWVSNTYYIPFEDIIPSQDEPKQENEVKYYQWVPMILLFMALLFKIPRMFWKMLTVGTAVNLDRLVTQIFELHTAKQAEKKQILDDITYYLNDWLEAAKHYSPVICLGARQRVANYSCFVCGRRYGNFFMTASFMTKILYLVNAIVQFFTLNSFLGTDFSLFGVDVMHGLTSENVEYLKQSTRFPRVTLCDFEIRQLQNVQQWTVQCVLPINLFNEKIFLFIWFWYVFLIIVSSFSLLRLFYKVMFPYKRVEFVKKYLKLRNSYTGKDEGERKMLRKFVMGYLHFDGVYVLRVLANNATELLAADIIVNLWNSFKRKHRDSIKINH